MRRKLTKGRHETDGRDEQRVRVGGLVQLTRGRGSGSAEDKRYVYN